MNVPVPLPFPECLLLTIKNGRRKEIPTNTFRQRLNLSGAIDIFSKKKLIEEDFSLNAESTSAFLITLEILYPEMSKIHVFCDYASYYKIKENIVHLTLSKIEIHFLPPYSPNLNPIERLWKLMNEKILLISTIKSSVSLRKKIKVFCRACQIHN